MAGAAFMSLPVLRLLLLSLFSSQFCSVSSAPSVPEAQVLLSFRDTLKNGQSALVDWVSSPKPCLRDGTSEWTGVLCQNNTGAVYGLQLENMSLSGTLDIDLLQPLPGLRTLSFMNNTFTGPFPAFSKLPALRGIFLSWNHFSGVIPDDGFDGMGNLRKLHLSWNNFTGPLPRSLARSTKLLELTLEGNKFSGEIPDLKLATDWTTFNMSDNDLEGPIPDGLSMMPASSFAGNRNLCGKPLILECPRSSPNKLSAALVVTVIVISIAIVLAFLGVVVMVLRRRRREEDKMSRKASSKYEAYNPAKAEEGSAATSSSGRGGGNKKPASRDDTGKLVFVKEDIERFEMQDLLRSSAEVLGSGNFGASYKASLPTGQALVVKRFKEMNGVGREDFNEHMRRLGRLSHPNLLPLVAYYYRKEEKLLVTHFIPYGSLALLLHGNRGSNLPALDWPTRLKIIKGVAKALSYLYDELPTLSLPHGHLKSSNVLLGESFEPILTDYALAPVMSRTHASQVMVAYKSPEYTQTGKVSRKSDMWSLGILILEVLTGKFPADNLTQGNVGTDLARWVNSVVREEWTGEVFDGNMKGTRNGEGEMLKLLQVGLGCCEANVEKRWELSQALSEIEELKVRDNDDDEDNSCGSEGDIYSSRAMTEDEFSFSTNN